MMAGATCVVEGKYFPSRTSFSVADSSARCGSSGIVCECCCIGTSAHPALEAEAVDGVSVAAYHGSGKRREGAWEEGRRRGGGGDCGGGGCGGDMCVLYEEDRGIATMTLNRPKVKHAFNDAMYLRVAELLRRAAESESVVAVVITGGGGYFTSGADVKEIAAKAPSETPMMRQPFGIFATAVMSFPKLLIAAVNGPAVGVGVTLLPHCDVVYAYDGSAASPPARVSVAYAAAAAAAAAAAVDRGGRRRRHLGGAETRRRLGDGGDRGGAGGGGGGGGGGGRGPRLGTTQPADFWTPFFRLAIVPEFCSSVTFPEILGWSLANEMLVMGRKLSAREALSAGLVSTVVSADSEEAFLLQVRDELRRNILENVMAAESARTFKRVMWKNRRPRLLRVFEDELVELDRRMKAGHPKAALKHLARRPPAGSSKL